MKRLLIVGTAAGGTGYMAEVLRACGLRCGHEAIFHQHNTARDAPFDWTADWDAESSWLAVGRLPLVGPHVVQVVRHPLAVVDSCVNYGFLQARTEHTLAIFRMCPDIELERTPHDRALNYWVQWHTKASLYAHTAYRIESLGWLETADVLTQISWSSERWHAGIVDDVEQVPRNVNTKEDAKFGHWSGHWEDFRPSLADAARRLAASFGYDLD